MSFLGVLDETKKNQPNYSDEFLSELLSYGYQR